MSYVKILVNLRRKIRFSTENPMGIKYVDNPSIGSYILNLKPSQHTSVMIKYSVKIFINFSCLFTNFFRIKAKRRYYLCA